MTVAIMGAGAIGSVVAAGLDAAGEPPVLVDVNVQLIEKIRSDGLTIGTAHGSHTFFPRATTDPGEIGPVDTVMFLVKGYHTEAAAQLARPLVHEGTTVATLQNGWGNGDILAGMYHPEQMVVGVSYDAATVTGLGSVAHTGRGPTVIGPHSNGTGLARAEALGSTLRAAGFEVTVTSDIQTEIWKKVILNSAVLPLSALTGLTSAALGAFDPTAELIQAVAAESVMVARALGLEVELQERLTLINTVLERAGLGKTSMLQDAQARRRTEIGTINGAVVAAAGRLGIQVPLNAALVHLIRGLERSWEL